MVDMSSILSQTYREKATSIATVVVFMTERNTLYLHMVGRALCLLLLSDLFPVLIVNVHLVAIECLEKWHCLVTRYSILHAYTHTHTHTYTHTHTHNHAFLITPSLNFFHTTSFSNPPQTRSATLLPSPTLHTLTPPHYFLLQPSTLRPSPTLHTLAPPHYFLLQPSTLSLLHTTSFSNLPHSRSSTLLPSPTLHTLTPPHYVLLQPSTLSLLHANSFSNPPLSLLNTTSFSNPPHYFYLQPSTLSLLHTIPFTPLPSGEKNFLKKYHKYYKNRRPRHS